MAQTRARLQGPRSGIHYKGIQTITSSRAQPAARSPHPLRFPSFTPVCLVQKQIVFAIDMVQIDPAYSSQQRTRSRAGTGHDPLRVLAPAPARRAPRALRARHPRARAGVAQPDGHQRRRGGGSGRRRVVVQAGERADEIVLGRGARAMGVRADGGGSKEVSTTDMRSSVRLSSLLSLNSSARSSSEDPADVSLSIVSLGREEARTR
jgi:hypothetical protein